MAEKLFVTFAGADSDKGGLGVDCLIAALSAVQDAARITANDLAARGAPDAAKLSQDEVNAQTALRLIAVGEGSFAAELELEPATSDDCEYASRALDALLRWDGYEDSSLPIEAARRLRGLHRSIPADTRVWLGDGEDRRIVEIKRAIHADNPDSEPEIALLHGRLKEVNWAERTAQLHRYGVEGYVRLKFEKSMDVEMLRLATQYVEVMGSGKLDENDEWTTVSVERISGTRSSREPFDFDAFLNNPNRKVFRSENVIRAKVPFDVDAFNRSIREGRDV